MNEIITWVYLLAYCLLSVMVARWAFRRTFPIPVRRWHMLRVFFWFEMAFAAAAIINLSVLGILILLTGSVEFIVPTGVFGTLKYVLVFAWFWMLIPYAAYLQSLGHKQKGTEA